MKEQAKNEQFFGFWKKIREPWLYQISVLWFFLQLMGKYMLRLITDPWCLSLILRTANIAVHLKEMGLATVCWKMKQYFQPCKIFINFSSISNSLSSSAWTLVQIELVPLWPFTPIRDFVFERSLRGFEALVLRGHKLVTYKIEILEHKSGRSFANQIRTFQEWKVHFSFKSTLYQRRWLKMHSE
jgi:hypothetical protein